MTSIICAVAEDWAIGFENRLLFRLKADLRRFRLLTTGHTVIMGRRTFESLPKGALPHRRNIVLTRNAAFRADGVETFPTLPAALAACKDEETFIIGGESVYRAALPLADRLCLTHIHAVAPQADVFFPTIDLSEWTCVSTERHEADADNEVAFTFADYVRK